MNTQTLVDHRCTNPVPYEGAERRIDWHTPADCFKLLDVQQRLDDSSGRMKRIETSIEDLKANHERLAESTARLEKNLDANTKATTASAEATAEILEIISTAKGFFRGTKIVGAVIKWALGIATAITAFWVALKSGGKL